MEEHQAESAGSGGMPRYLASYAADVDRWRHQAECARSSEVSGGFSSQELETAIDTDQLHLVYQPWMDLDAASYSTVEVLVRWEHPTRGAIGPAEFIPVAEQTGLIVRLGTWVIEHACRQLREWRDSGALAGGLQIAVNLSGRQLSDPELVPTIARSLSVNELEPDALCVEVTETALMQDEGECLSTLAALRGLGVIIAVDDFGTGYSSLARLKRLPVDVVKIPREFIAEVADDPRDGIILDAATQMAHALGLRVVAEGVETLWQAIAVRALGIDLVQGFYFCRPGRAGDISAFLDRENDQPERYSASSSGLPRRSAVAARAAATPAARSTTVAR